MYIASVTRQVLLYGGAAAAVAGVIWRVGNRRASALTAAEADAGQPRPGWSRFAPAALVVCGLVTAYWSYRHSIAVVLVMDDGGKPRVERKLAASVGEQLAPGARAELPNTLLDPVWLINQSATTVRVEMVQYDTAGTPPLDSRPVSFPTNTAGAFYHIDFVGPDDQPPNRVMGSALVGTFKYWLTW